ncbi:MAG: penicillin-binding protein activator [Burkholderiaceae bacterium]
MNRRVLLGRLARYGVFGAASVAPLRWAMAQRGEKKPEAADEEEAEEEKKKSTLVSDVEEFGRGRTRIALLLPNIEGPYRFAADAVLRGFQAAHAIDGNGIYVKVMRIEEDGFPDAELVFAELEKERYSFVVGPLIRTSVNALGAMTQLRLPTLLLNLPDQNVPIPGNSVLFSLAIEYEGHSAARYAFAEAYQQVGPGRPLRALPISDKQQLSKRSMDAFIQAWQAYGGEIETPIVRTLGTLEETRDLLLEARADVVFAAIDPDVMRTVRAAFAPTLPIYGTSRLDSGALPTLTNAHLIATPELDGVRVIEMPWNLMPDHPAVALYPRSRRLPHVEMQRLYAFGIDAYRVTRELMAGREQFELDGVTGRLMLDTTLDPRVAREPMLGEYRQGILVPAYAPAGGSGGSDGAVANPGSAPAGTGPGVGGAPRR